MNETEFQKVAAVVLDDQYAAGYKAGQERMRERAKRVAHGRLCVRDDHGYVCTMIRDLPIEEPPK